MKLRMNNEIRLKQKNLLIAFVALFILFIFMLTRKCSPDEQRSDKQQSHLPVIYAVTPTYTRPVQKAELTR